MQSSPSNEQRLLPCPVQLWWSLPLRRQVLLVPHTFKKEINGVKENQMILRVFWRQMPLDISFFCKNPLSISPIRFLLVTIIAFLLKISVDGCRNPKLNLLEFGIAFCTQIRQVGATADFRWADQPCLCQAINWFEWRCRRKEGEDKLHRPRGFMEKARLPCDIMLLIGNFIVKRVICFGSQDHQQWSGYTWLRHLEISCYVKSWYWSNEGGGYHQ